MKTHHFLRLLNNITIMFIIISSFHFVHFVEARRELFGVNSSPLKDDHKAKSSKVIDTSLALILILIVFVLVIIAWILIWCKHIPGSSFYEMPSGGQLGLDQSVINTFPTLLFSDVKKLKIGKGALECAVCLDEFRDEGETLMLLPKCCHLYHKECIDVWLVDHTTCPVCRANLVPNPDDLTKFEPQLGETGLLGSSCEQEEVAPEVKKRLQRSFTTGCSVVHFSEQCERFTLRLTDEVRRQLLVAQPVLQRTVSLAAWPRLPSSPQGYRSEGVGSRLWSAKVRGEGHIDAEYGV